MSVINTQPLAGASGSQVTGYNLTKSLRFRASASASLSRTPASAGNRQKWTWSGWVKRGLFNDQQVLFAGFVDTGNYTLINTYQDSFIFQCASASNIDTYQVSTMVLRDPAAWYHIVYAIDTTQATAANRAKMYVNGVQITSFSTNTQPPLNYNTFVNATNTHFFSKFNNNLYFDGYMAEVNFVDGQQLTPSDFGETDSTTGVWKPKEFTGTYGTNGFYLPFTDVATTSGSNAGLGKDFSGNGNYWTTNNISVTSGVTYDSMTDVPTLTDASTANYCVLNAVRQGGGTHSNGNLKYVGAGTSATYSTTGTMAVNSGKWYWEVTVTGAPYTPRGSTSWYNAFGFTLATEATITTSPTTTTNTLNYQDSGYYKNFSGSNTDTGSAVSNGDVLAVAVDLDANTFTFYKNNTSVASGTIGVTAGTSLIPLFYSYDGTYGQLVANFGQRPFAYTPPTGYKALNTYNLPDSTIVAGNTVMDALTWTGDNSTANATKNRTGLSFQPDMVWIKSRSNAYSHNIYDAVRGAGSSKSLQSDNTNSESTNASNTALYGYVSAFNSDGFQTTNGTDGTSGGIWVNQSGQTYVGWCWDANGAGSSNTNGSITSTVSVNASAGFSIVTYTGTGANATVGHGLGVAPSLIIWKNRNTTSSWPVWHSSFTAIDYIYLNSTGAKSNSAGNTVMNSTLPSSSVISLGTYSDVNGSGNGQVAYCWAEIAGFSKFGSYTGNGSNDGPFVYTGFRPRYIMVKRTDSTGAWEIYDTSRSLYNVAGPKDLQADSSGAENASTITNGYDFLSNGFKTRDTTSYLNTSGATYIYAAFAENPFKNSLAR